jgi:hypothetical protein
LPPAANPQGFASAAVQSQTAGAARRQQAAGSHLEGTLFTSPQGTTGAPPIARQTLGA